MSLTKKSIYAGLALMVLALGVFAFSTGLYKRVLGYGTLSSDCRTATASTTLSWMTPGTATTTGASMTCGVASKDSLSVFAWVVASSTQTQYRLLVERGMDGLGNSNFFQGENSLTLNATTTQAVNFSQFAYKFASSTIESQISVNFNGTGTTSAKLLRFNIPVMGANYLRLSMYLADADAGVNGVATSSDNGAVWMQGIGVEKRGN